jgi:ubiquinol-cytochrome c reductase core subunit 2
VSALGPSPALPRLGADARRVCRGYFAEVLGDAITQAKFAPHEYNEEVLPKVASEYEQAIRDPTTYGLDLAHQLAFRNGLGNSLFASPHSAVNFNSATAYAASAFAPSNVAVLGSGVDAGLLASYVSEFFVSSSPAAAALSTPVASYFGGEVRVPSPGHGGSAVDHFIVAFKGNGSSASADFEVLRHLLGGESSVKWSSGSSPLSKLASGRSSAKAFNLAYSDAGLFGIYITAPTSGVAGIATAAVEQLKNVAKGASAEAVKQAIAKAKFAAATSMETRANRLELVGGHVSRDEFSGEIDTDACSRRLPTLDPHLPWRRSLPSSTRSHLNLYLRCVPRSVHLVEFTF